LNTSQSGCIKELRQWLTGDVALRFLAITSFQEVEEMIRLSPAGYFIIGVSALAVTMAFSTTQSTSPDKGPEETVRHLETVYADAVKRQDIAALQAILAEDFLATGVRGELRNKAMELDDLKPNTGYSIDDFLVDDIRVRVFDNTAIVMGREILGLRYNKQPLTSVLRYTRVYVKRGDRWQIEAQQLTALPQASR
jgi:ketosteroid isomerase-like protein